MRKNQRRHCDNCSIILKITGIYCLAEPTNYRFHFIFMSAMVLLCLSLLLSAHSPCLGAESPTGNLSPMNLERERRRWRNTSDLTSPSPYLLSDGWSLLCHLVSQLILTLATTNVRKPDKAW